MACGVPLVTTRVGQAMDLVEHGENGFMVDVEDVDGLAHWSKWVLEHPSDMKPILVKGSKTAEANAYERQLPLWSEFMKGFVDVMKMSEYISLSARRWVSDNNAENVKIKGVRN